MSSNDNGAEGSDDFPVDLIELAPPLAGLDGRPPHPMASPAPEWQLVECHASLEALHPKIARDLRDGSLAAARRYAHPLGGVVVGVYLLHDGGDALHVIVGLEPGSGSRDARTSA